MFLLSLGFCISSLSPGDELDILCVNNCGFIIGEGYIISKGENSLSVCKPAALIYL